MKPWRAALTSATASGNSTRIASRIAVACSSAPGAGSEPVAVHGSVSGLTESTLYYYKVVARNSFATEHGGRASFETLPAVPKAIDGSLK